MLEAVTKIVEGTHICFLWNITLERVQRTKNGMWAIPAAGKVLWETMMQIADKYIGRRQGAVSQWVALRSIFEFCSQEQEL